MGKEMQTMLEFNEQFVRDKKYEQYRHNKLPERKLAVLSCMDTRLTELLPDALALKNGDIKLIKNAGAIINHPFGSVIRSLFVCVYFMGVEEIAVIGHYDCGMQGFDPEIFRLKMIERGIPEERLEMLENVGYKLDDWFRGFDDSEESVRKTVDIIRRHPLLPEDIEVQGFLIDPHTGRVDPVTL